MLLYLFYTLGIGALSDVLYILLGNMNTILFYTLSLVAYYFFFVRRFLLTQMKNIGN